MNYQGTKGDYSPNLNGVNTNGGDIIFGDRPYKPTGTETSNILQIISNLSDQAVKFQDDIDDTVYKKKLKQKLALYPDYSAKMTHDYKSLVGLYAEPYAVAWENSDVDELTRIKIAKYLSSRSIAHLEANLGNALLAVGELCIEIELSMQKNTVYDASAIRFFIYRQFIDCNVFPIIEGED